MYKKIIYATIIDFEKRFKQNLTRQMGSKRIRLLGLINWSFFYSIHVGDLVEINKGKVIFKRKYPHSGYSIFDMGL